MGKQIEAEIEQCNICQERHSANTKEPLSSHNIPERPWQVVGTDLFTWNAQDFIIIVDYYSRFFEMERLRSCTSSAVITKLKSAFARHGIAETVISNNGPCYSSEEFRRFANARRLRSILPMTGKQLQPRVALQTAVHERREACQHCQQTYYNRTTRPLSHLPVGTPIRFRQEDGSWRPATVTQHADTHRSYYIQTRDGQTLDGLTTLRIQTHMPATYCPHMLTIPSTQTHMSDAYSPHTLNLRTTHNQRASHSSNSLAIQQDLAA
ncbi:hypothetical protein N1851_020479 [Merluccius polli]|uniref:Integrase catalytic domain-containing protein n=1 Tax=Merluccius polli TaxID=89951 RepID=A0AA47MK71_MERPO|nr:hypothetical protein N1851_020479 [Merluccius polli]